MKKISILLFAVMMAGSLGAQIESFSEEDTFVSEPVKPAFNKLDYLQPHDGSLSPCGEWEYGYGIYNIIGEQLFCMAQTNISSPLYDRDLSNYVLVKDKDGLVLSKIQQGKYYIVKDILISKEEKDSIQNIFQTLNFTSDTLYFDKNGQLLDKNQPMPQKKRIYYLPKDVVFNVLFNPYREWKNADMLTIGSNLLVALYILSDNNGNEYYVPLPDAHYGKDLYNLQNQNIRFGKLVDISSFISVKGYNIVKEKFENQRITKNSYNYCANKRDIVLCKKIALKDGQVMAAITDTMSTTISYMPILNTQKRGLTWCQKHDSLMFMELITNYSEHNAGKYETMDFCTIHDLDSIETKIAYEKQKAEQEERKKDARKRQDLIKKYGTKIGQSIADGKACVGMNKEQCQEAMGTPNSIAKDTNNLGAVEVWTYSLGYQMFGGIVPVTVVTFINGKVTSVKEYTSWP